MSRKQAFYYDPSRNEYILLARSSMNKAQAQALPNAPKFAPPLDPESCTGKWFIPSPDITEDLQELEKDMHRAWRRVERDKKNAPAYVINKAAYLRRVFDHFLCTLHRQASKQRERGTFKRPVPLKRIEEPNMLNALRNLAEGRDYSVGALKPTSRKPTQTVAVKKEPSESRGSSPTPTDEAQDEGSPESTTAGPCTSTRNSDVSQESEHSQGPESSEYSHRKACVVGRRGYSRDKKRRADPAEIDENPSIKRTPAPRLDPEDSEEEEPDFSLQTDHGAQERRTSVDDVQGQDVEMVERTLVGVGVQTDSPEGYKGVAVLQQDSRPLPAAHSPEPRAFRSAAPEEEHLARVWSAAYPMLRAVMQDMPVAPEDLQPNPKKTMRLRFWEAQRAEALALLERMEETFQTAGSRSASTAAPIPQGWTYDAPPRFEKT